MNTPKGLDNILMGGVLSTKQRTMLFAASGKGKTVLALAFAIHVASGRDFLHWKGTGEPRNVLFCDGEMGMDKLRVRLEDAQREKARWKDRRPNDFRTARVTLDQDVGWMSEARGAADRKTEEIHDTIREVLDDHDVFGADKGITNAALAKLLSPDDATMQATWRNRLKGYSRGKAYADLCHPVGDGYLWFLPE